MNYYIIKLSGKQYRVASGDTLTVDYLDAQIGDTVKADVLLEVNGDDVEVGTPVVKQLDVKVLEHLKGDKIRVAKYKSKSRYRRVTGHRQSLTKVEVNDSAAAKPTTAKKATGKTTKAAK